MVAVNRQRGEIAATLDGVPRRLCLTLGALAELESSFAVGDLPALARRLSEGRLSANELIAIIAAGLRGGGAPDADEASVGAMRCEGGLAGFAAVAVALLEATFGAPDADGGVKR